MIGFYTCLYTRTTFFVNEDYSYTFTGYVFEDNDLRRRDGPTNERVLKDYSLLVHGGLLEW